jgi:hypothetical protein
LNPKNLNLKKPLFMETSEQETLKPENLDLLKPENLKPSKP